MAEASSFVTAAATSAPMMRLRDGIGSYDGTGDVASWILQLEEIAVSQGVDHLERHVPCLLAKGAYAVYSGIPAGEKRSWDKVKEALLAAFSPDRISFIRDALVRASLLTFIPRTLRDSGAVH